MQKIAEAWILYNDTLEPLFLPLPLIVVCLDEQSNKLIQSREREKKTGFT